MNVTSIANNFIYSFPTATKKKKKESEYTYIFVKYLNRSNLANIGHFNFATERKADIQSQPGTHGWAPRSLGEREQSHRTPTSDQPL